MEAEDGESFGRVDGRGGVDRRLGAGLAGGRRRVDRGPVRPHRDLPIAPFRDTTTAPEYIRWAFGEEDLVRCWFGEPVVEDDRAAVEYWAILRRPDGSEITIAGAAVLRFGRDGLVRDHRDYWTQRERAADPPAGWGR